jgi:SLT domain-containing protein
VSNRDCPLDTAGARSLWHAGGMASEDDDCAHLAARLQLGRRVRPVRGDYYVIGKGRRPTAVTKEKAERWTRWRALAQVRRSSNTQRLPYSLVRRDNTGVEVRLPRAFPSAPDRAEVLPP